MQIDGQSDRQVVRQTGTQAHRHSAFGSIHKYMSSYSSGTDQDLNSAFHFRLMTTLFHLRSICLHLLLSETE